MLEKNAKAANNDKVNASADGHQVPAERFQFRKLILKNPNYFGTLKESPYKPVKQIVSNTTYEDLTCIGYNQNFSTLEATIAIKLPNGYGGDLCSPGTEEYVRFFIDYGAGWIDAGVAAVNVHDIPNSLDCAKQKDKPLIYVVSLKIEPKTDYCGHPVLPKVRAILSWNFMPPTGVAGWSPVWGKVMECHIQIKPRYTFLVDVLEDIEAVPSSSSSIKILHDYAALSTCPLPALPELSLAEKAQIHNKADAHRFGLNEIHEFLTNGAIEQQVLIAKVQEWEALGLDLQKAIDILEKTNANTDYEKLECLGLNYHQDKLVATLRIKKPLGYSGSLCKPGSFEYVAFWADWDNTCKWTLLGIKKLNVHDFEKSFPSGGICYSVVMPVDLGKYLRGCEKPNIARIRAVLSWNIPPSTNNPDELKYWGNRIDAHVQIRPGEVVNPDTPPRILIGGIHVKDIDDTTGETTPDARFGQSNVFADSRGVTPRLPCPFGGRIDIQGLDFGINYIGKWYKIELSNLTTGSSPSALNTDVSVIDWDGNWHDLIRVGDYYQIESVPSNPLHILQRWYSSGDDKWKIHITIRDAPNNLDPVVYSITQTIQLDNTAPSADSLKWTPLNKLYLDISGGICQKFKVGDTTTINGTFVARDANFGVFSLYVLPAVVGGVSSNPVIPNPNTPYTPTGDPPVVPPGSTWSLNISSPNKMKPCGYVVVLEVRDRSIVNSVPYSHNHSSTSVGFCLEE